MNPRYVRRCLYGRYDVVDTVYDIVICYGEKSEDIDEVVRAMNAQNQKDKRSTI